MKISSAIKQREISTTSWFRSESISKVLSFRFAQWFCLFQSASNEHIEHVFGCQWQFYYWSNALLDSNFGDVSCIALWFVALLERNIFTRKKTSVDTTIAQQKQLKSIALTGRRADYSRRLRCRRRRCPFYSIVSSIYTTERRKHYLFMSIHLTEKRMASIRKAAAAVHQSCACCV